MFPQTHSLPLGSTASWKEAFPFEALNADSETKAKSQSHTSVLHMENEQAERANLLTPLEGREAQSKQTKWEEWRNQC